MKKVILIFNLVFISSLMMAQNTGLNPTGTNPDNSAALDIDYPDKGLLIPRVALSSTTDISTIPSPATSLLVYNINASMTNGGTGFYYYDGTKWTQVGAAANAGATGQSANTVYSNNQLQLTSGSTSYTLIPGLTQTITVPANSKVYITTNGGFQNSGTGTTYSLVDFAVYIDGAASSLQRRIVAANTSAVGNIFSQWNLSGTFALAQGSHTIQVRAKDSGQSTAGTNVAGTNDLIKGNLTVLIIKE